MLTRKLGRSGIEVSAVGFGCWPIGGLIIENGKSVGWGNVDDNESIRAIHRAMDLGVTFFDTSSVYGRSEEILGRAFANKRHQVVLATKFGKTYERSRHEITGVDTSPQHMRASLEGSLQRLQTDYVDLLQFHVGDCPADQAEALRDALEERVQAGFIRSYGWSTDSLENAKIFAQGPHCSAIQQAYNLFEGNADLLAFCEANHLASINRGPLSMGLLTGKYNVASKLATDDVRGAGHVWMSLFPDGVPNQFMLEQIAAIRDILTSNGRTVAQGALAWLWGRSPNTLPIPGFKGMGQAEENARAMDFGPLAPDQMAQIEQRMQQVVMERS